MKLKVILGLVSISAVLLTSMAGCNADNINTLIDSVGNVIGTDIEIDVKQEDLDNISEKANELKDNVENIVEDEEVRDATEDLVNALIGAVKENREGVKDE